jgi:hypothetical protein
MAGPPGRHKHIYMFDYGSFDVLDNDVTLLLTVALVTVSLCS